MTIKLGKYQHYKGKYYEVIHTGWHSDTMENYVVYRALYDSDKLGKKPIFVKHSDEFCKNVIVDGEEVPRFRRIDYSLGDEKVKTLISFMKEIEKLKHVTRAIPISGLQRYENSAEHSWHLAILLVLLQKHFPDSDMEKMLKMALIHDLVEVYTGDVPAFDDKGRVGKEEREQEAAKRLFSLLPLELGKEFHGLFDEFEEANSIEAKVVLACDKLQAMMQAILSDGAPWKDNNLDLQWIEDYHQPHMFDENLLKLYTELIAQIKEIGGFKDGIDEIK